MKDKKNGDSKATNNDELRQKLERFIEETGIVQITGVIGQFAYYDRNNKGIEYFKEKPLRDHFYSLLRGGDNWQQFMELMERKGRNYTQVVASFGNTNPNHYNLLSIEAWLTPKAGKHSELFDILLASIGNDKKENIEHLERVIAWKYTHPDSPFLPAIVLFNEGSTGKNLLVDTVLSTIFANQTKTAPGATAVENFNGHVVGKTVVLLNECEKDKVNVAKLKQLIGQKTFHVNEKFKPQFDAPSTQLWLIATNDTDGAFLVSEDGSGRRWSHIKSGTGKTLEYWLNKKLNLGLDRNELDKVDISQYVEDAYGNPEECAKWLHHICEKWQGMPIPKALHGEDHRELLESQSSVLNQVCERVFLDPDFIAIPVERFCAEYETAARTEGVNPKYIKERRHVKTAVKAWLERHAPQIVGRFSKSSYSPENRVFLRDDRISPVKSRESAWINTHAVPADTAAIHIGLDGQLVDREMAKPISVNNPQQAANSPLYLITSNQ